MLSLFSAPLLANVFFALGLFISFLMAIFLYWREGRRELVDSHVLFDTLVVAIFFGLAFARVFDFLLLYKEFGFSVSKLLLFHLYPGLNFYGAIVGFLVGGWIYLRQQKTKLFWIFDLAAPAISFGQFLFFLTIFFRGGIAGKGLSYKYLWISLSYLLLYWILRRLFSKKRHVGYFSGFYLVCLGLIGIFSSLLYSGTWLNSLDGVKLLSSVAFFGFGAVCWFILAKRKPGGVLKDASVFLLLGLFKIKRLLSNTDEAGTVAKNIIFLPYHLLRLFLVSFKKLFRELKLSFWDFIYAIGIKKTR